MKKILSALSVLCILSATPLSAYADTFQNYKNTITKDCLVYQPYDDAGQVTVNVPQSMNVVISIKQFSEESDGCMFYAFNVTPETDTAYIMPLEAGNYEISINIPKYSTFTEKFTVENPDFSFDFDSTQFNYSIAVSQDSQSYKPEVTDSDTVTENFTVKHFKSLLFPQEKETSFGDINGDGFINSSDASDLLGIYANMSSDSSFTLSEQQISMFDINKDGTVNSSDASALLEYYAYISSGGDLTIESYFNLI